MRKSDNTVYCTPVLVYPKPVERTGWFYSKIPLLSNENDFKRDSDTRWLDRSKLQHFWVSLPGDFFWFSSNDTRKLRISISETWCSFHEKSFVKLRIKWPKLYTYCIFRANLKRSNFSDQEIDVFFDLFKEDPTMEGLIVGTVSPDYNKQTVKFTL